MLEVVDRIDHPTQDDEIGVVVEPAGPVANATHDLPEHPRQSLSHIEVGWVAGLDLDATPTVVVRVVETRLALGKGEEAPRARGIVAEVGFIDLIVGEQRPTVDLGRFGPVGIVGGPGLVDGGGGGRREHGRGRCRFNA